MGKGNRGDVEGEMERRGRRKGLMVNGEKGEMVDGVKGDMVQGGMKDLCIVTASKLDRNG